MKPDEITHVLQNPSTGSLYPAKKGTKRSAQQRFLTLEKAFHIVPSVKFLPFLKEHKIEWHRVGNDLVRGPSPELRVERQHLANVIVSRAWNISGRDRYWHDESFGRF